MWIIEMSFEFLATRYECQTPQPMLETKNSELSGKHIKNFELTACDQPITRNFKPETIRNSSCNIPHLQSTQARTSSPNFKLQTSNFKLKPSNPKLSPTLEP